MQTILNLKKPKTGLEVFYAIKRENGVGLFLQFAGPTHGPYGVVV